MRVNRDLSGVFRPRRAKLLCYIFVGITSAPMVRYKSFKRIKLKLRDIFWRGRGGFLFKAVRCGRKYTRKGTLYPIERLSSEQVLKAYKNENPL